MGRYLSVLVLVASATLVASPPALAQSRSGRLQERRANDATQRAERYLRRGLSHYGKRDFDAAIGAFSAGYDLDPRPEFLFALAQAERRSGDCTSATEYYHRFLETEPNDRQVRAAMLHIAGCRIALRAGSGMGSRRSSVTPAVQEMRSDRSQPWYRDLVGDTLLGTGAVALTTGAVFLLQSQATAGRTRWAETYRDYDLELASARRSRWLGVSSLAVGSLLVAGAAYRFYDYTRESRDGVRLTAISPEKGGVSVALGGRF